MDRRTVLRGLLAAVGGGLLAACDDGGASAPPTTPASGPSPGASEDLVARYAPGVPGRFEVINASFEQLTGPGRPFAFGLLDESNAPVRGADVEVALVPPDSSPIGPFAVTFEELPGVPQGLYRTSLDLDIAGETVVVVRQRDGQAAGATAISVADPSDSRAPAPGDPATVVPTATTSDLRGVARLCTAEPPCGMHEISLDDALLAGRPVVVTFATPAFCQTVVCGPSVEKVDGVRRSRDWGEIAWVHAEIFADDGRTLAEPVEAWELPSEPWLFTIGADGVIADRADGPLLVIPDEIARLVEAVRA